ncbi:MAG: hypothetical protein OXE92_09550 [Bacteroidetes bacterium]|nr:hypothetical protein [Bacteroidota bacterium]
MRMIVLVLLLVGCSSGQQFELSMSGEKAERLQQFYFSSYTNENPFEVGILEKRKRKVYFNLSVLKEFEPEFAINLESRITGNFLDAESLKTVVQATYFDARNLPQTLTEFNARWAIDNPKIFEVHGPVTRYLRQITMSEKALQYAILNYFANGEKLYYPTGTVIKAEHISENKILETTAMMKRSDGFWDFVTYDSTGYRASETLPNPRALATPTQCVGCHLGKKPFEPEDSWPSDAPDAPGGIRKWYTGARDQQVTDFFKEHSLRSDLVLGLYATTYVSDLRVQRKSATLDSSEIALLDYLGL